jgi:hypothetical protein
MNTQPQIPDPDDVTRGMQVIYRELGGATIGRRASLGLSSR